MDCERCGDEAAYKALFKDPDEEVVYCEDCFLWAEVELGFIDWTII